MAGTYREINYSLRPAKAIERKMLCEAFSRLYPFGKIGTYRYVGFGSIYFSDFQLFHRNLGINDMLSIEKDAYAKECFEFNKPYKCVVLDCRPASEVLPELDWKVKTIVWLDYESKLDEAVLSDIGSVCARAGSGSLLLVSVNVHVERDPDETTRQDYMAETGLPFNLDDYRLRELRKRLGDCLPPEIRGNELRGKGLAAISHRIMKNGVEEVLSVRNSLVPLEKKLVHRQIFNFHYSDGTPMLTVGWILFEAGEQHKFDSCSFNELNFVRSGEEPYAIELPCLTMKEMRYLNAQLPKGGAAGVTLPGVPPSDIERYAEIYRYFPTFAEAIFT